MRNLQREALLASVLTVLLCLVSFVKTGTARDAGAFPNQAENQMVQQVLETGELTG
jgi:hypothetical protein